jgi:hypothetical protein
MATNWAERMDYVLRRGLEVFGRSTDEGDRAISYQRSGYPAFPIVGIPNIDPRLESVDLGKYYAVTFRLADFEEATFAASVLVTFTNITTNGSWVSFDGITYTFRTAINNSLAYEVQRGSTAVECAANLAAAINATATAGVNYSSATTAHPTCKATLDGNRVRVEYRIPGIEGNNKIAQEALYGASLDSKLFVGGGPLTADEVTFDGLTYKVGDIGYDAEGGVTLRLHLKTL